MITGFTRYERSTRLEIDLNFKKLVWITSCITTNANYYTINYVLCLDSKSKRIQIRYTVIFLDFDFTSQ